MSEDVVGSTRKLKKFVLDIPEVWISRRVIYAETWEEARQFACDAEEIDLDYSHTMDVEHWDVVDEGELR